MADEAAHVPRACRQPVTAMGLYDDNLGVLLLAAQLTSNLASRGVASAVPLKA